MVKRTPNNFQGWELHPFYSAKFLDDYVLAVLVGVFSCRIPLVYRYKILRVDFFIH